MPTRTQDPPKAADTPTRRHEVKERGMSFDLVLAFVGVVLVFAFASSFLPDVGVFYSRHPLLLLTLPVGALLIGVFCVEHT